MFFLKKLNPNPIFEDFLLYFYLFSVRTIKKHIKQAELLYEP